MSPPQAGLLTAFLAKTIETFSTTVFITFLGQTLSRRAFRRSTAYGTTLVDLNLRSLVVQPGRLVTHLSSFRCSMTSMLGALTLLTTLLTMLYTTASEALGKIPHRDDMSALIFSAVQPKLAAVSRGMTLHSLVKSSFANPTYLEQQCITPVPTSEDLIAGSACLVIKYAYQANLDLQNYLNQWEPAIDQGLGSSDPLYRPTPVTQFYENNTRVTSSWIRFDDTEANSLMYGRLINNVTLAVPHIGIVSTARDPGNGILQLEVHLTHITAILKYFDSDIHLGSLRPSKLLVECHSAFSYGKRSLRQHEPRRTSPHSICGMAQRYFGRDRMVCWKATWVLPAWVPSQWNISQQNSGR